MTGFAAAAACHVSELKLANIALIFHCAEIL
jgi:hypothetical protein